MKALDEFLEPISEDQPGGPNLRYDPVCDEIKEARKEDPELPQGEWKRERKVADWGKVVSLCETVLAERSKDLQVAAWLTEGLIRREGFSGLHLGLRLLIRLHEDFWDHLHPELEEPDDLEFRAAPLEWVGQYLDPALDTVPLNAEGYSFLEYDEARRIGTEEDAEKDASKKAARKEAIDARKPLLEDFESAFLETPKPWYKDFVADIEGCREALKELDGLCDERYEDVAPSFMALRDRLEESARVADRLLKRKLELEPDPPEEEEAAAVDGEEGDTGGAASAGSDASTPAGGGTASVTSGGTAQAPTLDSWDGAAAGAAAAAAFMRQDNPTSPAPYLLLRGLRWGELRTGAEDLDPRLLEAPPTPTRTRLKSLLLDRKWKELLEAGEEVMATPFGRGWLDLQRYVVTALDNLGPDYDRVVHAVHQSIRSLLEDVPDLLDMTLMDDSPTANRETLQWLESDVLGEEGAGAATRVSASPARRERGDPHARAMDRLRSGDPRQAVELLMQAAAQEQSARAKFLRRSEATRIMVSEGMEAVALPILQEMMELIERHSLEDWEAGETVAQPLSLLYTCMDRTQADAGKKEELYLRICRLDPLAGMRLNGGDEGGPAAEPAAVEESGAAAGDDGES